MNNEEFVVTLHSIFANWRFGLPYFGREVVSPIQLQKQYLFDI